MPGLRVNRILVTACVALALTLAWVIWSARIPGTLFEVAAAGKEDPRVVFVAALTHPDGRSGSEVVVESTGRLRSWRLTPGHWRLEFRGYRMPFLVRRDEPDITWNLPLEVPAGFVPVPPGPFLVGPRGRVEETNELFFAARHEVTRGEFAKFLEDVARGDPDTWRSEEERAAYPDENPGYGRVQDLALHQQAEGVRLPVGGVSWYAAVAYCRWRTEIQPEPRRFRFRLPTRLEWEKMARGTDGRVWPWGNDARRLRVHTTNSPAPVDVESSADLASPYGLFHMQSNLAEWTADAHDAAAIRRVVMGRSWSRHANALRVFGAESEPASLRTPDLGFRLVADLLP